MQIVVVHQGDSLWTIARRFGVSVDEMVQANALTHPERLVPGQALLVPQKNIHRVQPGESLWLIARRYGVSLDSLLQINRIEDPNRIMPGMSIIIPEKEKMEIEVNAYLEPSGTERDVQIVNEVEGFLTYLSLFSAHVEESGGLSPLQDMRALEAVRDSQAIPMLVITNFRAGTFSPELAHAIFSSDNVQDRLIENVLRLLKARGYRALQVDFEHIFPADRTVYNRFLERIAGRLHAEGYLLSTALAPKTSGAQVGTWYEGHDYPAHGRIADFVVIMTYEWGWSGGPPMPVAPIPQVRRVLDYAVSVIPREKILMGAPLYGYDWTLPYVPSGAFARVISPVEAVDLAARVGVSIQYDATAEAPTFRYYDREGREHVVWFEDVRSMQAKFNLVKEYRLRGISFWKLGGAFPQNWTLLADQFRIRSKK
ncbi:Spore germination protein yaaH [[Clostridium] ultunense Esp]|uniref:LysM peptidoglycan-binding domain-containing protein n=1 Tax=Thermicanus aegyptius TaxID=94009 RepID=UPI0002B70EEE|nr:glycoside hydrolase family 18 protein [Thermicanus aegyptius]CCQ97995.1 Spore germination protein yaaH [[Clostridium] ultunense Esp]